jgi:hypothetical protein
MNSLKLAILIVLAVFLSACVPKQMYYWGNYSQSLYDAKKNPTEQSILTHQQSLENIIQESQKNNLRVPPGVYAELGYVYFRQNKKVLAIQNFNMERQLYPESALLMDRLVNAANLADKPKPSERVDSKTLTDKTNNQEK